mgnify:CR=1 FL=1
MFPELSRDDVFRIETRRLWLRWPRMADAAAMVRHAGTPAVAEGTKHIPLPFTAEAANAAILKARQGNADGEGLCLALTTIVRPEEAIGMVCVVPGRGLLPELGFWLGEAHWGKGFATEAAQAMIDITFGISGIKGLTASVAPVHQGARRVLKRCGFELIGSGMMDAPARGGAQPGDFYRLERTTWSSLKEWRSPRMVDTRQMEAAIA